MRLHAWEKIFSLLLIYISVYITVSVYVPVINRFFTLHLYFNKYKITNRNRFRITYFVLVMSRHAPSDTQPQYGSLEAIQDL